MHNRIVECIDICLMRKGVWTFKWDLSRMTSQISLWARRGWDQQSDAAFCAARPLLAYWKKASSLFALIGRKFLVSWTWWGLAGGSFLTWECCRNNFEITRKRTSTEETDSKGINWFGDPLDQADTIHRPKSRSNTTLFALVSLCPKQISSLFIVENFACRIVPQTCSIYS